jgi:hypothetical protein
MLTFDELRDIVELVIRAKLVPRLDNARRGVNKRLSNILLPRWQRAMMIITYAILIRVIRAINADGYFEFSGGRTISNRTASTIKVVGIVLGLARTRLWSFANGENQSMCLGHTREADGCIRAIPGQLNGIN